MNEQRYQTGLKNMEFHLGNSETLSRDANTSLSILLAAGLGALGYTANLIDKSAPTEVWAATGAVAVHLLIICGMMVRHCLSADDIMPPTNEPRNLKCEGYEWEEILPVEIDNLQVRIDFNQARNKRTGTWLNRLRYAAFAVPTTFALVWGVVSVWDSASDAQSEFRASAAGLLVGAWMNHSW
jgi:hypothetical protein